MIPFPSLVDDDDLFFLDWFFLDCCSRPASSSSCCRSSSTQSLEDVPVDLTFRGDRRYGLLTDLGFPLIASDKGLEYFPGLGKFINCFLGEKVTAFDALSGLSSPLESIADDSSGIFATILFEVSLS